MPIQPPTTRVVSAGHDAPLPGRGGLATQPALFCGRGRPNQPDRSQNPLFSAELSRSFAGPPLLARFLALLRIYRTE